jgi:muconolactone D-isomerase
LLVPGDEHAAEFFVTSTPAVPEGTPAEDVKEAKVREAGRAAELAKQGHLVRLWALPAEEGVSSALGLWRADSEAQMEVILQSLPLYPYLRTQTTRLTPHPNDPTAPRSM